MALAQDPVWRAGATPRRDRRDRRAVGLARQSAQRLPAVRRHGAGRDPAGAAGAGDPRSARRPVPRLLSGRTRPLIPLGFSVFEASLMSGIPHASACGGRGRCSLCRVRVLGSPDVPPPEEPERRILERLGVDPAQVRLACQLRPRGDLAVIPLVPPAAQSAFLHRRQERVQPQERFSRPYVHRHARFDGASPRRACRMTPCSCSAASSPRCRRRCSTPAACPTSSSATASLAMFGLRTDRADQPAPRRSPRWRWSRATSASSARYWRRSWARACRFGIGVQCGRTIVGEIGFRDHVTFTGLGDPPNVASRLQGSVQGTRLRGGGRGGRAGGGRHVRRGAAVPRGAFARTGRAGARAAVLRGRAGCRAAAGGWPTPAAPPCAPAAP